MKQSILILSILLIALAGKAQSEKYTKTMQQWVPAIDTTHAPQSLLALGNTFQRIADAEKTQWLPYYYAALCQVNLGYMTGGASPSPAVTDPYADKAEELLQKAETLVGAPNAEIFIVKKMIASLRLMADPMSRYATYGPIAMEALQKAKGLDPENPRIFMLEGQDLYYTPEQFGGDKEEAKKRFESALSKFEIYQPASDIHPSWGKSTVQYFLSLF